MNNKVSIAEAKKNFSALINQVAYGKQPIIITSRNKPKAIVISINEYQLLEEATSTERKKYRMEAFNNAQRIRDKIAGKIAKSGIDPVQEIRHLRDHHDQEKLDRMH